MNNLVRSLCCAKVLKSSFNINKKQHYIRIMRNLNNSKLKQIININFNYCNIILQNLKS